MYDDLFSHICIAF